MFNWIKRVRSKAESRKAKPGLSIIVVVYDMPTQAQNTLISLGTNYQQDVSMDDFEVIIVENESQNLMDAQFIESLPENMHYFMRTDLRPTPVHAINFAASKARGDNICLIIDGARTLTPGVVKNILLGHRLADKAVVSVPGYHLGETLQQESVSAGYGVETERELMSSIDWPNEGYRLFDIACFSGTSAAGFFLPSAESNCISLPRDVWHELGGCDEGFSLRGGGFANLDFYKRACEHPSIQHVVLPGEGTFHQFHGGVTTGGEAEAVREEYIVASEDQYRELRGENYSPPITQPIHLGQMPEQSIKFFYFSAQRWLKVNGKKALPQPEN
jgi:hypothetical protein